MADPYVGEVRFFGFPYAPVYWGLCNGAGVLIRQQSNLFALLGTQFGGDGVTSFQLPNLASRTIVGAGLGTGLSDRPIGAAFGEASVTLQTDHLPPHLHTFQAFGALAGTTNQPSSSSAVSLCSDSSYTSSQPDAAFDPAAVSPTGGGQPHGNVQPTLGLTPAIALVGTWPDWD